MPHQLLRNGVKVFQGSAFFIDNHRLQVKNTSGEIQDFEAALDAYNRLNA